MTGSMGRGRIFTYMKGEKWLHSRGNVGKYIPYMDPIGIGGRKISRQRFGFAEPFPKTNWPWIFQRGADWMIFWSAKKCHSSFGFKQHR